MRGVGPRGRARLGVDIGGTFTDVVLDDGAGRTRECKLPSTPADYGDAVVEGALRTLGDAGLGPEDVAEVVHGCTIGQNAILGHTGPPVALITTEGFRDVLEIARIRTPTLYDLTWEKPRPLVPRRHRFEVRERISAAGRVVRELDLESVRDAARRIDAAGITTVAVCLINSYVEPRHEHLIGDLLAREHPSLLVSLSCEVLPQIKEYERTSTTVIDAYLRPVMRAYLRGLAGRLREAGIAAPLLVMRADGGMMSAGAAAERPIFTVGSGPAAGVVAARHVAQRASPGDVIAFDMGGTTAKASSIEGGRLQRSSEFEVRAGISAPSRFIKAGGYLLMVPAIDVAEVGNGAGSIARVDAGGALRVGPESAGADPGPACYGRGGTDPTITDANLVLGYLNPRSLVGGELRIDRGLAERAVEEKVAAPLGVDLVTAAWGIHSVANSNMMRALRAVTVERGRDPRSYELCAFGGSGPVHAVHLAAELRTRRVLVPPFAGLLSAVGLLMSEPEHHVARSHLVRVAGLDAADLGRLYRELEERALAVTGEWAPGLERSADVRYAGQSSVLTIPLRGDGAAALRHLAADFAEEYGRTYGHRLDEAPIEIVSLRVAARGDRRPVPRSHAPRSAPPAGSRQVYFGPRTGYVDTPLVPRSALTGAARTGPLVIEEYDSTTVVPPGCAAHVDGDANIVVEVDEA